MYLYIRQTTRMNELTSEHTCVMIERVDFFCWEWLLEFVEVHFFWIFAIFPFTRRMPCTVWIFRQFLSQVTKNLKIVCIPYPWSCQVLRVHCGRESSMSKWWLQVGKKSVLSLSEVTLLFYNFRVNYKVITGPDFFCKICQLVILILLFGRRRLAFVTLT